MPALTRLRLPITILIAVVFAALLALAAWSSTAEANHSWGATIGLAPATPSR